MLIIAGTEEEGIGTSANDGLTAALMKANHCYRETL